MTSLVIGVDVQDTRGCAYAVMKVDSHRVIETGWITTEGLATGIRQLGSQHQGAVFAIDAPRMPLLTPRSWYWRKKRGWYWSEGSEKGKGRHCEIVVKAYELANPQWTPLKGAAPTWMQHGFRLFEELEGQARTLEVFPSASYRMLNDAGDVRVDIPLSGFLAGPRDMLDAVVAAVTGCEFLAGRGQEAGGGDGLGTIVLPRPIKKPASAVLSWPT